MSHVSESLISEKVKHLQSLPAIREQCSVLFQRALVKESQYFDVHMENMDAIVERLIGLINSDYGNDINKILYHSRWRHFNVGGVDRVSPLIAMWLKKFPLDGMYIPTEIARRLMDLAVVSVLLDAGAGPSWKYVDHDTGKTFTRSEGLALASLHLFINGAFSSDTDNHAQVDACALENIQLPVLEKGLQVTPGNPLIGLESRCILLRSLGHALRKHPLYFSNKSECYRPGHLLDFCLHYTLSPAMPTVSEAPLLISSGTFPEAFISLPARYDLDVQVLWPCIVHGLSSIWPNRLVIDNIPLGDVWSHKSTGIFVPFHKLSQWLTYSLLEPLQAFGIHVKNTHLLTGLPEYRNGGLFIDMNVLSLKIPLKMPLAPEDEVIVEWRALTVCLLDETARRLAAKTHQSWPLAKVLEAGTWKLGRIIAKEKRADGSPPLNILSDGTVF